jgi:hypothetical protein
MPGATVPRERLRYDFGSSALLIFARLDGSAMSAGENPSRNPRLDAFKSGGLARLAFARWSSLRERVPAWQSHSCKVISFCGVMSYWHGLLCQSASKVGKVAKYSARSQGSGVRRQESGVRGQRSEVREQKVGPWVFRISNFGFRIFRFGMRGVCAFVR